MSTELRISRNVLQNRFALLQNVPATASFYSSLRDIAKLGLSEIPSPPYGGSGLSDKPAH